MESFIRLATPEDVEGLTTLEICLFDKSFSAETLREELRFGPCWVATGKVSAGSIEFPFLGYLLSHMDGSLMDITRLGVIRSEQRKGIATALLQAAIPKSNRSMLTVRKTNRPAIELYKKNGFTVVGHLQHPAAWVMVRPSTYEQT